MVAIVALLSVDGVVVAHRTHVEHVQAAERRAAAAARRAAAARVAYAQALRTPLTALYRTLQPLQNDIDFRSSHPTADIDYPVRDALTHTTATPALEKEEAAVAAVKPPVDLTSQAGALRTSITRITTLTKQFAAHAGDTGETLADDLDTGLFAGVQNDLLTVADAVNGIYLPLHQLEPPVAGSGGGTRPVPLQPSHDSWLLAADSACDDGEIVLSAQPAKDNTIAELRSTLTLEVKAGDVVTRELTAAKAPAGDIAARTIVGQLPVFAHFLTDDSSALADVAAGNDSGTVAALQQEVALVPDLDALSKAFQAYGAMSCANFFGTGSGSSSSGSGSGNGSGSGSGSGPTTMA